LAAFTVSRPGPLPAPPFPATFDRSSAVALAGELSRLYPNRSPGSEGAAGAAQWYADRLAPYGLEPHVDAFSAVIPGRGKVPLRNILAVSPGRSPQTIVVMAHRDNTGAGPGANDNASGTAALLEIARAYSRTSTGAARGVSPGHTVVFLSTDGGAYGVARGAATF